MAANVRSRHRYSNQVNRALPVPAELQIFLDWAKSKLEPRRNGILLNWYDGRLGHYIGRHRDSTRDMVAGAPIVTISLGEERTFRLRPWRRRGHFDLPARHGGVIVMPFSTNLAFTHEVPKSRQLGRRISITLRGFETSTATGQVDASAGSAIPLIHPR